MTRKEGSNAEATLSEDSSAPSKLHTVHSVLELRLGSKVVMSILTRIGTVEVKGIVTKMPPEKPSRGQNRVSVTDGEGRIWRPYLSQIKLIP